MKQMAALGEFADVHGLVLESSATADGAALLLIGDLGSR